MQEDCCGMMPRDETKGPLLGVLAGQVLAGGFRRIGVTNFVVSGVPRL